MGGENDAESSKNSNQILWGGDLHNPLQKSHSQNLAKTLFILLTLSNLLLLNLHSIELSQISGCGDKQDCKISTYYDVITNSQNHTTGGSEGIQILTQISTFINYGDIKVGNGQQTFTIQQNGYIEHFINYGTFGNLDKMGIWVNNTKGMSKVTNYGVMGSINYGANSHHITTPLTLNNLGLIGAKGAHIAVMNGSKVLIQNYVVKISETATAFNNFSGSTNKDNFSHLVINIASNNGSISFKDENSKLILDFGNGFDFGAKYLISKLATDESGNAALGVDFSRLTPKNDIYYLTQSGEYFITKLVPQHSTIGILNKSNIRTMNNFWTMSNSMIYPRKYSKSQNLRKSSLRDLPTANRGNPLALSSLRADSQNLRGNPLIKESIDSALSLKSYESFTYQNESQNLQTRRIQRQNKRNYSRNLRDSSLRADSQNLRGNPKDLRAKRSNHQPQNLNADSTKGDYYFVLTPFINHNYFFESGRYNLSGFDYGFLTAFSSRVAESNSLGTHFAFSYSNLNDKHDKDLSIRAMNFMLGVNYKLDLVYDMFLKARGDFFYFANALDSATLKNIKPNNLGFGASVLFGKEWDFKQGGVLGIEAGLDYKALKSNKVSIDSQSYQQALYNLIYADLGLNYQKYFGGFGINLGGGFKANLAPNLAKVILLTKSQNLRFALDNDKFLGYANVGLSYVLNAKNFDMEFSLAYYGNFGDRVISNGGGFEWRVGW